MLIVFTSVTNAEEGELLAESIITEGLAACVQVLPPMTSVYVWEGRVQKETEHLLLVKTMREKWEELCGFITEKHSYEVPEIIAVDAEKASGPYLAWLHDIVGRR